MPPTDPEEDPPCPDCNGDGEIFSDADDSWTLCDNCDGAGTIESAD